MSIALDEIANTITMAADLAGGFIRMAVTTTHPMDVIFCYTAKTQLSGHWTVGSTLVARGLVVKFADADRRALADKAASMSLGPMPNGPLSHEKPSKDAEALWYESLQDATVIARGMPKFFTVEASQSDWGRAKLVDDDEGVTVEDSVNLDMNAPATVADKLDGALAIGAILDDNDNAPMVAVTKGSFHIDEARQATRQLREHHDPVRLARFMKRFLPGASPLFETISPDESHVVDYGEMDDVVFLGVLSISDGVWTPVAMMDGWMRAEMADNGFTFPKTYRASTLGEAMSLAPDSGHEGMVVTLENGPIDEPRTMFKIKWPEFLRLQHLKSKLDHAVEDTVWAMPAENFMDPKIPDVVSLLNVGELPEATRNRIRKDTESLVSDISMMARAAVYVFQTIVGRDRIDLTRREDVSLFISSLRSEGFHPGSDIFILNMAGKSTMTNDLEGWDGDFDGKRFADTMDAAVLSIANAARYRVYKNRGLKIQNKPKPE